MEHEGLNYFVIAVKGCQWLAGFQYREWAEAWKGFYCATGLVVTHEQWLAMQSESLREDAAREAMKPRANGGILGDLPKGGGE